MTQWNDTCCNTNMNIPLFFLFSNFSQFGFLKNKEHVQCKPRKKVLIHLGASRILMLLFYIPQLVTCTESRPKFGSEWEWRKTGNLPSSPKYVRDNHCNSYYPKTIMFDNTDTVITPCNIFKRNLLFRSPSASYTNSSINQSAYIL